MNKKSILTISLGIFLFTIFSGFSPKNINHPGPVVQKGNIRYQVNIQLSNEVSLCNTYLVQIVDENQQAVLAPKVYVPGVSGYSFFEVGTITGVRAAVLVRAGFNNFICQQELFTPADVKYGIFMKGQTYSYLLQPKMIPQIIIK